MSEANKVRKYYSESLKYKRLKNLKDSLIVLQRAGVHYDLIDLHSCHYRIGDWNFYPTTGTFYNPKTKTKGRGVFKLLKLLGK